MIAFALFIGLLTTSRTFIVVMLFTLVIYVLLQNSTVWKKIRTVSVIFFFSVVGILLVYLIFPDIILNYISRFTAEDVTGGRGYLLEYYNDFVFSSPERMFFGIGMQDIAGKVKLLENVIVLVPHNGYQEILVAWGLVGFVLMAFFMVGIFVHARKRNRSKKIVWIHYLPLLLLLINILAGQFVSSFRKLSLVFIYEVIASYTNYEDA